MEQTKKQKKLHTLFKKNIDAKLRSALLMLISNYYEMNDMPRLYKEFGKPKEFEAFERKIQGYVVELGKNVAEKSNEEHLKELHELKKEIAEIGRAHV